jgi:hypothetical protein
MFVINIIIIDINIIIIELTQGVATARHQSRRAGICRNVSPATFASWLDAHL